MFSTSPRTGAFVCRATVIDLRTIRCETSDGIVTTIVPANAGTSEATVARRSVPGGRSMISASSSPHAVSAMNSRSAWASIVPRQVCASAWVGASHVRGEASEGSRRSIDMTRTPSAERGGSTAPPLTVSAWPRTPSILAIDGPLRSASSTTTRQPEACHVAARFAVTVDLPTPPLPETTATTKRTSARRRCRRACCSPTWATTSDPPSPTMSRYFFTLLTPGGAGHEEQRNDRDDEEHDGPETERDVGAPRRGDRGRLRPDGHHQHLPRPHQHQ